MKFPHTHFRRGQRVRIVTRDGNVLVLRFIERIARAIVARDDNHVRYEIPTRLLRNVSIYRELRYQPEVSRITDS